MAVSNFVNPLQFVADKNHPSYVRGDKNGYWIAVNQTHQTPFLMRYAADTGRMLRVDTAGAVYGTNGIIAVDQTNDRVYALDTSSTFWVVDSTPNGSTTFGVTAVNGLLTTHDLSASFPSGNLGLVHDPPTNTMWSMDLSVPQIAQISTSGSVSFFSYSQVDAIDIFADGAGGLWITGTNGTITHYDTSGSFQGSILATQIFPPPGSGTCSPFAYDPVNQLVFSLVHGTGGVTTEGFIVINAATTSKILVKNFSPPYDTGASVGLAVDDNGNLWTLMRDSGTNDLVFQKWTPTNGPGDWSGGATMSTTKDLGTGFDTSQSQRHVFYMTHSNLQPSLWYSSTGGGFLYAGNDTTTDKMELFVKAHDAPSTPNYQPLAMLSDFNHTSYPANYQKGVWVALQNRGILHYSPDDTDNTRNFITIPVGSNATAISQLGHAADQAGERLYILDNNSFDGTKIWVIDTTPISSGGVLTGVNGFYKMLNVSSTWGASAALTGMVFDAGTGMLWVSDGTANAYRVNPTTGVVTTFGDGGIAGSAITEANGLIGYAGSPGFTFIDPTTGGTSFTASTSEPAFGSASDGTNDYVNVTGSPSGLPMIHVFNGTGSGSDAGEWNPNTAVSGDPISIQGLSRGQGSTVWVSMTDTNTSAMTIANFSSDGSTINFTKSLPNPFTSASENGFAFVGDPGVGVSARYIFATDNANNELWSADAQTNTAMAVRTTWPYAPVGSLIHINASLGADSAVTATATELFNVSSAMTVDSSLSASEQVTRFVNASMTANSSITENATAHYAGVVAMTADSSVSAGAGIHFSVSLFAVADSSVIANEKKTEFLGLTAAGDSSFAASAVINRLCIVNMAANSLCAPQPETMHNAISTMAGTATASMVLGFRHSVTGTVTGGCDVFGLARTPRKFTGIPAQFITPVGVRGIQPNIPAQPEPKFRIKLFNEKPPGTNGTPSQ